MALPVVRSFSRDELIDAVALAAGAEADTVRVKPQLERIAAILDDANCTAFVAEQSYVDRDYLRDYAAYLVSCFHAYERHCTRFHFFAGEMVDAGFAAAIVGGLPSEVKYLGFMVIKPLSKTFLGRTCIKWAGETREAAFCLSRTYTANLFGLPLAVESIAMQEQDCVVSACATSALWTAFHATQPHFSNPEPAPAVITQAATARVPLDSRTFPHIAGLNLAQMADAVRSVGLEPAIASATNGELLRATVHAYLRAGLPVILAMRLPARTGSGVTRDQQHAVTITGYRLDTTSTSSDIGSNLRQLSQRIDRLYIHDDQLGPFVPLDFTHDGPLQTRHNGWGPDRLELAWPMHLLVPLYHKLRIGIAKIIGLTTQFNTFVRGMSMSGLLPAEYKTLIWDIRVATVNAWKLAVRTEFRIPDDDKICLLTAPTARYLWRATARPDGGLTSDMRVDLVFDATDIDQGDLATAIVIHDATHRAAMQDAASGILDAGHFNEHAIEAMLKCLRDSGAR